MTKRCTKCGEPKPLDEFYKRGDSARYRSACRACLRRDDEQRARRRALRADSPERAIRSGMLQRCYNPNNPSFQNYGERGIEVCSRWIASFAAFLEDVGPRPTRRHTIERIDNDGPYSPENCRWATRSEQNRNTRQNVKLVFRGRTQCMADWSRETGLPLGTIRDRIFRCGWSVDEALSTPRFYRGQKRSAA